MLMDQNDLQNINTNSFLKQDSKPEKQKQKFTKIYSNTDFGAINLSNLNFLN